MIHRQQPHSFKIGNDPKAKAKAKRASIVYRSSFFSNFFFPSHVLVQHTRHSLADTGRHSGRHKPALTPQSSNLFTYKLPQRYEKVGELYSRPTLLGIKIVLVLQPPGHKSMISTQGYKSCVMAAITKFKALFRRRHRSSSSTASSLRGPDGKAVSIVRIHPDRILSNSFH